MLKKHTHKNWKGSGKEDAMKEKAMVKKDWDKNHLGKGGLLEKAGRAGF